MPFPVLFVVDDDKDVLEDVEGQLVQADVGWPLERRPLALETSVPGVLAAGDVRHGSAKRVGEGSIAAQLVHNLRADERPSREMAGPAASAEPR